MAASAASRRTEGAGPASSSNLYLERGVGAGGRRLGRGQEPRGHVADEADQVFVQLLHRRVTLRGIASQALRHHRFEARREQGLRQGLEVGRAPGDPQHDRVSVLSRKGPAPGGELEGQGTHREDVGAGIRTPALDDLGGHVGDAVEPGSGPHRLDGLEVRDADVEDPHVALGRDPDVGGLQVEVQKVVAMGFRETQSDLAQDVERPFDGQRLVAAEGAREVDPFHDLGDHERAALVLARLEDHGQVRVSERPRRAGGQQEPLPQSGVLSGGVGEGLDRDRPSRAVLGLEHHTGTTAAERFLKLIGADRLHVFPRCCERS